MSARFEATAPLCLLLVALSAAACGLTARMGRDEAERIDAITSRGAQAEEERAFEGLPPLAAPPNTTPSIIATTPSYEIRPDPRRGFSSGRARKGSRR